MSASLQDTVAREVPPATEDSSPPASTSHTASSDTQFGSLFKRHSDELWFDNGNVILAARDTGFRVFRSLLTTLEGCPVVHVSDAPEDVAHFLRVLLPISQRIFFSRKFSFSFNQVSTIIRLAHKYNVPDILDQVTASLQDYFTTDFNVWDSSDNQKVIDVTPQQAIGVINLARLVDNPSLLPTAFYTCALEGGSILDGYEREDKTIEHLSQQDIKRCINGRNKLADEAFAIISEVFLPRPCEACKMSSCRTGLQRMLEDAIKVCKRSSASVLQGWDNFIRQCAKESRICAPCEKAVIEREFKARKRVWDALLTIFDIKVDGWGPSAGGGDGSGAAALATT